MRQPNSSITLWNSLDDEELVIILAQFKTSKADMFLKIKINNNKGIFFSIPRICLFGD